MRAAWRVTVAARVEPERLVFVEECVLGTPRWPRSLRLRAQRRESLAPKKRPGSAPKLDEKAIKLLEEDLEERPSVPTSPSRSAATT